MLTESVGCLQNVLSTAAAVRGLGMEARLQKARLQKARLPCRLQACVMILARVPDPEAQQVPELTMIVREISIAQVTQGEEGCQH